MIINFELAKLLKQKGYNKITTHYYVNEQNTNGLVTVNWDNDLRVPAPEIIDVVRWLYDTYTIWICIFMDDDSSFGYHISRIIEDGRLDYPIKRNFTNSDLAAAAAIEYCLNNIICQ